MSSGTAPSLSGSAKATIRRWLAVLCVSVFVFSGFLHTIQHVEAAASTAVAEISAGGPDDGSTVPEKPAAKAGEHCCGCATAAVPVMLHQAGPCFVVTEAGSKAASPLTDHASPYDPPPPKTLT